MNKYFFISLLCVNLFNASTHASIKDTIANYSPSVSEETKNDGKMIAATIAAATVSGLTAKYATKYYNNWVKNTNATRSPEAKRSLLNENKMGFTAAQIAWITALVALPFSGKKTVKEFFANVIEKAKTAVTPAQEASQTALDTTVTSTTDELVAYAKEAGQTATNKLEAAFEVSKQATLDTLESIKNYFSQLDLNTLTSTEDFTQIS